jgi:hypothetical protein
LFLPPGGPGRNKKEILTNRDPGQACIVKGEESLGFLGLECGFMGEVAGRKLGEVLDERSFIRFETQEDPLAFGEEGPGKIRVRREGREHESGPKKEKPPLSVPGRAGASKGDLLKEASAGSFPRAHTSYKASERTSQGEFFGAEGFGTGTGEAEPAGIFATKAEMSPRPTAIAASVAGLILKISSNIGSAFWTTRTKFKRTDSTFDELGTKDWTAPARESITCIARAASCFRD